MGVEGVKGERGDVLRLAEKQRLKETIHQTTE
jgi:hypothetical protein